VIIFAPVSLTFKDFTFPAQSALLCFVWVSEQLLFTFLAQSALLCFVWVSEQLLFPCTALTDWGFYNCDGECLLRGTEWIFKDRINSILC
jgi:hypothetical protein